MATADMTAAQLLKANVYKLARQLTPEQCQQMVDANVLKTDEQGEVELVDTLTIFAKHWKEMAQKMPDPFELYEAMPASNWPDHIVQAWGNLGITVEDSADEETFWDKYCALGNYDTLTPLQQQSVNILGFTPGPEGNFDEDDRRIVEGCEPPKMTGGGGGEKRKPGRPKGSKNKPKSDA